MARSVTEAQSHSEGRVEEVYRECMVSHGLQQCIVYSLSWECSYKLNDKPVRERVTASIIIKDLQ